MKKLDSWLQSLFFLVVLGGIIITPLIFSFVNQELFEFPKVLVVYATAALATGLWLARMIINRSWMLPNSKLDFPILAFFASQLIATVFSLHQYTSIFGYYGRFNGGLLSTLAYTLIYFSLAGTLTKLGQSSPKKAQKAAMFFLISIVAVGLITAVYAIPEKFGYSPSCLFATGQFDTNCWKESTNPKYRIFGTFGQPNWLAAWLVTVLPIALAPFAINILKKKINQYSILSLAVSSILIWAVWLTDSRSGLLALFGGGISFLVLIFLSKKTTSKLPKVIFTAFTFIILLVSGFFAKNWWQTSQNIIPSSPGGSDSGAIRRVVWSGALKIFQHYPWLGSGPETFAYSYYQFRPVQHNLLSEWDFLYNKAHNEWLNILANTGIVGFLSFLWIQLAVIALSLKICQLKDDHAKLFPTKMTVIAITTGLIALQISNFFGFSTVTVNLIQAIYMSLLAWFWAFAINKDKEKIIPAKYPKLTWWQKVLLLALIPGQILIQKSIFNIWQADADYTQGFNLLQTGFLESGSQKLIEAIQHRPQEALFYDSLADQYANYAQVLKEQENDDANAQKLVGLALSASDAALKLNPHHLNFYKTKVRILTKLASFDLNYVDQALDYISQARALAPTDAKLSYNQAKIEFYLEKNSEGLKHLEETLQLKANYPEPRFELAKYQLDAGQLLDAKTNYQYVLDHLNPLDPTALQQIDQINALLAIPKTN